MLLCSLINCPEVEHLMNVVWRSPNARATSTVSLKRSPAIFTSKQLYFRKAIVFWNHDFQTIFDVTERESKLKGDEVELLLFCFNWCARSSIYFLTLPLCL